MSRYYGDCIYGEELYKGVPETPEGTTELFAWEPNWETRVRMRYRFNTVISKTRKLVEQRKPQLQKPLRTEIFSVLDESKIFGAKLENYFKKYHAKQMLIPIYTEPVLPDASRVSGNLTDLTSISVNSRMANCFNFINLTELCIFIDFAYTVKAEIHGIDRIYQDATGWHLQIPTAITAALPSTRTVIYPLFDGLLRSKRMSDHTSNLTEFQCEFEEVFLYGI